MSWLLFMDESGHDHKNMPMEVRGGIALHTSKIWPFIKDWDSARAEVFGEKFVELGGEIKGSKLLENKKFAWAKQQDRLDDSTRRKGVRRFLTVKQQNTSPKRLDFSSYGQASILMAERIFDLLFRHEAVLFASMIPRGAKPPANFDFNHYLRKDHVFLVMTAFVHKQKPTHCSPILSMCRNPGAFLCHMREASNELASVYGRKRS